MPTATPVKAPTAHSYSRMQVFSSCPLSFKLQHIDKIPTDSSDALEIGAAAHEFFDRYVKAFSVNTEIRPSEQFVLTLAAECFQKEARDQSNFKDYLEICKTFAAAYKPDPAYPIVETEHSLAFGRGWKPTSWMDPGVMFRAKIDRIEAPEGDAPKKIRITDYKTGFAGAIDTFQLDIYALLASLIYPTLEQVEIQFYYVKSGFKQVKLLEVKDLNITKIQIESLIARMEGEIKWKAKPGSRCLTCPVASACTEKPSDMVKISTKDVALTLGAEIAFLEAQAKAKKKGLNAWCKQNGQVDSGGLLWNHWPKESMKIEMAPLLSACVSYQVDPAEILNPDSQAVKKAFKTTPGFCEAITPYISMETSTYFGAKKADGDE